MKKFFKLSLLLVIAALSIGFLHSCKNKDPSVIKVFVRSSSNELLTDARVVIIGDVYSTPPTAAYVDTMLTNTSGFASFDMEDFFGSNAKKGATGYFDIIVRKDGKEGTGRIRCRSHITNVETVYLEP